METGVRAARAYAVEILSLFALAALAILYGPGLLRKLRADLRVRRAQRGEAQASDATLLYERMLRVLERRGMRKPPWLTPAEFARVLPASELAMLVEDLTGAYNQFRFGGRRDAAPRMVQAAAADRNARIPVNKYIAGVAVLIGLAVVRVVSTYTRVQRHLR